MSRQRKVTLPFEEDHYDHPVYEAPALAGTLHRLLRLVDAVRGAYGTLVSPSARDRLRNRLATVLTDTLGIAPSRKAKSLLANWGGDGRAGA